MTNPVHINNSENIQVQNAVSTEIISNALNTLRREEENLVGALRKQAYQERIVRDLAYALDSVLNMVDEYKANELCTDHNEDDEGLSDLSLQHLKDHVSLISDYVRNWADANVETSQDILAEQRALIAQMVEKKA